MSLDAEKFHALPSANRRPRKANDIIQYDPEDLRTKGATGMNLSVRVEDVIGCPRLSNEAGKRGEFLLPPLFGLSKPSMDWIMPTSTVEENLFYSAYQFKRSSHQKTPSQLSLIHI